MTRPVRAFFNAADAFARLTGCGSSGVGPGHAVAEMILAPHHLNGAQTVHGGALFTLADFAFAAAVNAGGQLALSINASIAYHRGAVAGAAGRYGAGSQRDAEACQLRGGHPRRGGRVARQFSRNRLPKIAFFGVVDGRFAGHGGVRFKRH